MTLLSTNTTSLSVTFLVCTVAVSSSNLTHSHAGGPAAFALHDHDNPLGPSVLMNVPVQWAAVYVSHTLMFCRRSCVCVSLLPPQDYGINDALTGLGMGIAAPVGYFVYDPVEDCGMLGTFGVGSADVSLNFFLSSHP